jgi:hypothetical protein
VRKTSLIMIVVVSIGILLSGCQSAASNTDSIPTTAEEIVKALQDAGIPIAKVEVYTAENDPNSLLGRPDQYITKANFSDSRIDEPIADHIGVDNGGSIETFDNAQDAKKRYDYISEISKSAPMFAEYEYLIDKAILRISKHLTPEQAAEYENKFKEILK